MLRPLVFSAGLLAWLAVVLVTGGCRGAASDARTVVFSYGVGAPVKERLVQQLLDEFEALHPDIDVHRHPIAGVTDTDRTFYLSSLGAGSSYVDVFEMDLIWLAELAAGGLLLDLTPLLPDGEQRDLLPAARDAATYDGRLYAVPFYLTLGALWYRPTLMAKHGLTPPATWIELVGQAKLLSTAEGIDGFLFQGRRYEGLTCFFLELYHNCGGELHLEAGALRFDEEALLVALRRLHALVDEEGLSPRVVDGYDELDAAAHFGAGEAAFMRAWQTQGFDLRGRAIGDDYAYIPPPDRGASLVGGALLGVNARSRQPEAALELARFWLRLDVQRRLARQLGYAPVRAELYLTPAEEDPALGAVQLLAGNVRFRPRSPGYHAFSVVLMREVHALLSGDATPEAAAAAIVARTRELSLPRTAGPGFPERLMRLEQY